MGAFGGGQLGALGGGFGGGGLAGFGGGGLAGFGGGQLGALGVGGGGFAGAPLPITYGYGTVDSSHRRLAAVLTNSLVHIRDLESGRIVQAFNSPKVDVSPFDEHDIVCATFSPDGKTLITGGVDRAICFWDVETGKRFYTHEGHSDSVALVWISADSKHMIAVSADGIIRVWKLRID
jgi:WD40 repeat protein